MSDTPPPPPQPEVLYKLMPERFSSGPLLPFLSNALIRFSPPGAMNDPLEVRGFVDSTDYEELYDSMLATELEKANKIEDPLRSFSERLMMHNVRGSIISRRRADPKGAKVEDLKRLFKRIDEIFGILSLTARVDCSSMWSHYANRHAGVAIGFDFAKLFKFADPAKGFSRLRPVIYTDEMDQLKLNGDPPTFPQNIFFRKSSDWGYEKEWRIFNNFEVVPKKHLKLTNNTDAYGLPIRMVRFDLRWVREIRLGVCATDETFSRVREFVRESMRPIKIFKMRASETHYGLEEELVV